MINEKEYVISKQLLRSATIIGVNIEEANVGYSKRDFTAKTSIASKMARETKYWLPLLKHGDLMNENVNSLFDDANELVKVLSAVLKTSQGRKFE